MKSSGAVFCLGLGLLATWVGGHGSAEASTPRRTDAPDAAAVSAHLWSGGPLLGDDVFPLDRWAWSAELVVHYGHRLLSLRENGERVRWLQGDLAASRVSARLGLGAGVDVGLAWDFLFSQSGMRADRDTPWVTTHGSGDLTAAVRWLGRWALAADWNLAAGATATAGGYPAPGTHPDYFGSPWRLATGGVVGFDNGQFGLLLATEIGYREPEYLLSRRYGLFWEVRAAARMLAGFPVLAEVAWTTRVSEPASALHRSVSNVANFGVRVPAGRWCRVGAAVGAGVTGWFRDSGPGEPDVFTLFSVEAGAPREGAR